MIRNLWVFNVSLNNNHNNFNNHDVDATTPTNTLFTVFFFVVVVCSVGFNSSMMLYTYTLWIKWAHVFQFSQIQRGILMRCCRPKWYNPTVAYQTCQKQLNPIDFNSLTCCRYLSNVIYYVWFLWVNIYRCVDLANIDDVLSSSRARCLIWKLSLKTPNKRQLSYRMVKNLRTTAYRKMDYSNIHFALQ